MKPQPFVSRSLSNFLSRPPAETSSKTKFHRWHKANHENNEKDVPGTEPVLTVVLFGWLGSQQKHLKKYADWYNSQGINAVTFCLTVGSIFSLDLREMRLGKKLDENIANLADDISLWLAEKTEGVQSGTERQLLFHTFSNTGWLTYGVLLEQLPSSGNWAHKIKGLLVDSAPASDLDPQIWTSGFLEAFSGNRRRKSHGKGGSVRDSEMPDSRHTISEPVSERSPKRTVVESVSRALLKIFFSIFFLVGFQIPLINNRLSQLITILKKEQPPCPQLYLYSSADKVIPSKLVESFMEKQRDQGRTVRGFDFQTTPHVDHFRSAPEKYTSEVRDFFKSV